jgi:hypothetical protein
MPQNTTTSLTANTWTQVTNADVTAIRICNLGTEPIWVMATAGATPPSNTNGALPIQPGEIMPANLTLADLFPGVAGTRVYVRAPNASRVSISHA